MKNIEILLDGEVYIVTAAANMHQAGKEISRCKETVRNLGHTGEIVVLIDGAEYTVPDNAVDVKRIAANMKSERVENKILGDMNI